MCKYKPHLQIPQGKVTADFESRKQIIYTVIIRDFNSKLGKILKSESCIGSYGLGPQIERGQINNHNLKVIITFFCKKKPRKWPWQSPKSEIRNEIDSITTNEPTTITGVTVSNLLQLGEQNTSSILIWHPTEYRKTIKKTLHNQNDIERLNVYMDSSFTQTTK